ncbi:transcriptional regulator [Xenophilus sp. AP218F]|nr:transcriptional regulator [Xenophilus sp. AP218F]
MINQRYTSVWDAIENTPEAALNMKWRSVLITALNNHLISSKMSQAEAAQIFQVTQQRIADLISGKTNSFSLDELVKLVSIVGLQNEIELPPKKIE